MAKIDSISTTQHGTTDATNFFEYSSSHKKLFSVLPGVPTDSALEMASCFLGVARDCAYSGERNSANAAAYLVEMAKGVVDSLVSGIDAKPDDCALANVFARLTALRENGVLIIAPTVSRLERDDATGFLEWASQQAKGCAQ